MILIVCYVNCSPQILAELSFVKGKIEDSVRTLEELLTRKPSK